MKNKDILLDVIGDTDEKLVPDLTVKKKQYLKADNTRWRMCGGCYCRYYYTSKSME